MTTVTKLQPAVFYGRTSKTSESNGLEAQLRTVQQFAELQGFRLIRGKVFVEPEIGKGADSLDRRPALRAALEFARERRCTIICSKLNRLSRDVTFIRRLMIERVPIIAAALGPDVDPFTLHIHAALAETERAVMIERTKSGLAAAKAKGRVLGNPTNLKEAGQRGGATGIAKADSFAQDVMPLIRALQAQGFIGAKTLAAELNTRGVATARGGDWHRTTVSRLLARAAVKTSAP